MYIMIPILNCLYTDTVMESKRDRVNYFLRSQVLKMCVYVCVHKYINIYCTHTIQVLIKILINLEILSNYKAMNVIIKN